MSPLDFPLGQSGVETRLAEALRGRRWRLRSAVQDLRFEVQGSRERVFDAGQTLATIHAAMGGRGCEIVTDASLVDAILARAPEPVSLATLDAHDAALMLEHLLTEQIEATERATGLSIRLDRVDRGGAASGRGAWAEIVLPDSVVPLRISLGDRAVAEKLASAVFALDREGPGVVPGMAVAIGPVNLSRAEIAALQAGDEVLLEGATLDRLVGAVLLDERHFWPIMLIDGGIVADGALAEATISGEGNSPVQAFFTVGVTAESSPMRRGDRMPLQRVEERRMVLRLGDRIIGRAGLVSLADGLAIRFFGRDGL
jgi:hypothetical protein